MLDAAAVLRQQVAAARTMTPPAGTPGAQTPGGLSLLRARTVRNTLCATIPDVTELAGGGRGLAAEALACAISRSSGRAVEAVVYGSDLTTLAGAGAPLDGIPRVDSAGLAAALGGRRSDAQVLDSPSGGQLAVAFPLRTQRLDGIDGIVQLSTSTSSIDDVLGGERRQLAIGGGAVLAIALGVGLLLTSRALAPLRRLTETARALAAGDLRARSRLEPRRDEVGTLAHSFDDMADRIEAAFAAQAESEARMRRFIGDASHELRTPVTALKGYLDVLRRGAGRDPEALDAALESMAREAERMRVLVLDLLSLARLDAQRPLDLAPVDLGAAVRSVVADDGVADKPGQLDVAVHGGVVVRADPAAVQTIARNLLVNACKYAPLAAQRWHVWSDGGRGLLRVEDAGPGIAATDLPHVFERFYRGEKTRAREEGGSGLGLSIVQGLARSMGGDATVESVEGHGTAVTVWFPLAAGGEV